jgi:hypothetical protein
MLVPALEINCQLSVGAGPGDQLSAQSVRQHDAAMHLLRGSTAFENIKPEHAKKAPHDRNVLFALLSCKAPQGMSGK